MTTTDDIPAVLARPSATVILTRQGIGGIEVFMVRRLATTVAFPGAYVFPGGVVDAQDWHLDASSPPFTADDALDELSRRGGTPPRDAAEARAIWRAALRELFEEAGVLLARDERGAPFHPSEADTLRLAAARRALQARQATLAAILADERLRLDYRRLTYFSHWITPEGSPRRFDARFFVTEISPDTAASHCAVETTECMWVRPTDALARHATGDFPLVLPTMRHLKRLSPFQTTADLLAFAARKPVRTIQGRGRRPATDAAPAATETGECW